LKIIKNAGDGCQLKKKKNVGGEKVNNMAMLMYLVLTDQICYTCCCCRTSLDLLQ